MEINEFFVISNLLEYYKNLLSNKQKCYLEEMFENDLSYSEIGEKYHISRQAVHENIKNGIEILKKYEKEVGCFRKDNELYNKLLDLKKNYSKDKLDKIIKCIFK